MKPPSPGGVATEIGSPPQAIRQRSATMKETPSVTSTCANCWPASRRSNSRSISAPSTATSSAVMTAPTQKFSVKPSAPEKNVVPR